MKLIVFDVEGTLFKATMKIDGTDYPSTMWQPIAYELGEAAMLEERKTHQKWDNLEYSNYLDWVKATIDIHRKYSLKKETFDGLIRRAEYNTGVEEFFDALNRREWIPVLISGGFQNLIRRAQNELDIEYGFGACEYYFDDYGYLEHYNIQPSDFDGKIQFIDTLISTFKLNKKTDWVFIGDGKNDVPIAKQAPLAFGINPHEKLKSVDGLVEINSFMDILPYLEKMDKQESSKPAVTEMPVSNSRPIALDDIGRLNQRIMGLKLEIRELKQKVNDLKGKSDNKDHIQKIPISKIDYEKTPRQSLHELLKGIHVVLLGLDENSECFRRLGKISSLRLVHGMNNRFDPKIIQNADFLFIYKNCITHSDVWHACQGASTPPTCFLLEPTNNELLENAMANVLYRYIYK